jgi:phosphoglycolate phosphatase
VLQVLAGERHRAAHVGDSRIDVETARNAGVAAWAVPWGYNGGEPIAAAGPQRVFESLAQVAEYVIAANAAAAVAPA